MKKNALRYLQPLFSAAVFCAAQNSLAEFFVERYSLKDSATDEGVIVEGPFETSVQANVARDRLDRGDNLFRYGFSVVEGSRGEPRPLSTDEAAQPAAPRPSIAPKQRPKPLPESPQPSEQERILKDLSETEERARESLQAEESRLRAIEKRLQAEKEGLRSTLRDIVKDKLEGSNTSVRETDYKETLAKYEIEAEAFERDSTRLYARGKSLETLRANLSQQFEEVMRPVSKFVDAPPINSPTVQRDVNLPESQSVPPQNVPSPQSQAISYSIQMRLYIARGSVSGRSGWHDWGSIKNYGNSSDVKSEYNSLDEARAAVQQQTNLRNPKVGPNPNQHFPFEIRIVDSFGNVTE